MNKSDGTCHQDCVESSLISLWSTDWLPAVRPLGPIHVLQGVHHHSETRDSGVAAKTFTLLRVAT